MKSKIILATIVVLLQTNLLTAQAVKLIDGPLGVERVAASVGSYIPYISEKVDDNHPPRWLQIDLGDNVAIDAVKLYPFFQDGIPEGLRTHNFPARFRLEAANDAEFTNPLLIADRTVADYVPEVPLKIETYKPEKPLRARYVRLTVTSPGTFELWRFEVISSGRDVAEGKTLADSQQGSLGRHALLRPQRPEGEDVVFDHPEQITTPKAWRPVKATISVPQKGVTVGGLFGQAFDNNINYLLTSISVHDMAHNFLERAGREPGKYERNYGSWGSSSLGGSLAGRFLMGAGNTLRWHDNAELRRRLDTIVDVIEDCARPDGYIFGYPENMVFHSHNNAYSRGWLTQGLIEAGISGNSKVWSLLRQGGDWFNSCPYLPEMMFRVPIGIQGMVANSRTYLDTPVGKPEDIQVLQRYFQVNFWLDQLIARNPDALWQYPYERVHSYLVVTMNAYMDMYMATGDQRYIEAMKGGWELFSKHFMHTGGSISLLESYKFPPHQYPPDSRLLRMATGELCGNVFWTFFNQQLHLIYPDEEKYVAEMEKSIYNIGIANQESNGNIRYHAHLLGPKSHGGNSGTCCEGQGCRLYGALPEFVYKIAKDGIYVDLFNESTIQWEQKGKQITLHQHTGFPASPEVRLQLSVNKSVSSIIHVRVPSWASSKMDVLVNGKKIAEGSPGTYVAINRKWYDNDEITFTLPMNFKLTKYSGTDAGFKDAEAYALEYGPILMAITGNSIEKGVLNVPVSASELITKLNPIAGKPLHFTVDCSDKSLEYIPYYVIDEENFTCYPIFK